MKWQRAKYCMEKILQSVGGKVNKSQENTEVDDLLWIGCRHKYVYGTNSFNKS